MLGYNPATYIEGLARAPAQDCHWTHRQLAAARPRRDSKRQRKPDGYHDLVLPGRRQCTAGAR
ncbi:conserved protein of unknown function [Ectopseudomonas oleovorans]|uniref:Uncharacterized protein n=1 Tax=Ectopseudomonas oleovorans TaxID=301 RepID=A0A653B701_ECTOL|nr:conserved protein of unknown function [Pseudomonas oleovorans]